MRATPSPTVRGREPELAVLARQMERLRAGSGSVVVLEGAAGIGKSRLVSEAMDMARGLSVRGGAGGAEPTENVAELVPLLRALFDGDLVRIALASDDRTLAEGAVALAERRALLNPGIRSVEGAHAHARGLLDDDTGQLAAATKLLGHGERPLALASALEDLGVARVRQHSTEAGVEALGQALVAYTDAGASWDARRVRRRLRASGVRRRLVTTERPEKGWAALTESELTVARLVAEGLTNRETAERLFVSPHTVNSHLRHAFAKRDINSRVELTRRVDAAQRRQ